MRNNIAIFTDQLTTPKANTTKNAVVKFLKYWNEGAAKKNPKKELNLLLVNLCRYTKK